MCFLFFIENIIMFGHLFSLGLKMNVLTTNTLPSFSSRIVQASGVMFTDESGKEYVDLSSSTLNLALGYRHSEVSQAVSEQLSKVWFVPSSFNNPVYFELAQLLVEAAPDGISAVNLRQCNGTDAVDFAIKLARCHTRRTKLLCGRDAWHGISQSILPLFSRNTYHRITEQSGVFYAEEKTLESMAKLIEDHPDAAAVILDPLGVAIGLYEPEKICEGLHCVRELCNKYGIIFIMDEIQTFGGYIGDNLFACCHYNVTPDIICIGKALGAGLPLSATLCRSDLKAVISKMEGRYTYGGQPLACAAAVQAIKTFMAIQDDVRKTLETFTKETLILTEAFSMLCIRQVGFFTKISRQNEDFIENWTKRVEELCVENGLLIRNNFGRNVLLKPSIVIPPHVIEVSFKKLSAILMKAEKELQQPSLFYSDLIRYGIHPTLLTRIKKKPPGPNNWDYVGALLAEISPTLSVKEINIKQQVRNVINLRQAGICAAEVVKSEEEYAEYTYIRGVSLEKYMVDHIDSDPALVNGLVLQHQQYVEMAHDAGLSIPDRWPGNAIVGANGAGLTLIDFDITYEASDGDKTLLFAFEEIWSTFQCLSWVKNCHFRQDLSDRLCYALVTRYRSKISIVWNGLVTFYGNPKKPYLPESLSPEDYVKSIDTMKKSFSRLQTF